MGSSIPIHFIYNLRVYLMNVVHITIVLMTVFEIAVIGLNDNETLFKRIYWFYLYILTYTTHQYKSMNRLKI